MAISQSVTRREPDVNSLTEHIENLECDLDVALSQIDQKNRDIESKQIRIDILENKLKQLQIDVMGIPRLSCSSTHVTARRTRTC